MTAIGVRRAGDLLPIGRREHKRACGSFVGRRHRHDVVACVRLYADDLHRRFPKWPFDPIARLDKISQEITPLSALLRKGIDKTASDVEDEVSTHLSFCQRAIPLCQW